MCLSKSGVIASGVTSRPVKPVPPVVMTTSMSGSEVQRRTLPRISAVSSGHTARSASQCPASAIRSARMSPERSVSTVRESDTVRIAIDTGMKVRVSSRRGMVGSPHEALV